MSCGTSPVFNSNGLLQLLRKQSGGQPFADIILTRAEFRIIPEFAWSQFLTPSFNKVMRKCRRFYVIVSLRMNGSGDIIPIN